MTKTSVSLHQNRLNRERLIRELLITGTCVFLFVVYLIAERLKLTRTIRDIPLRICVTGTRGKSSVTRLIASCLRESGRSVLAKTTGSKPCLIFPDGEEIEVERRGSPSILEGKGVLDIAVRSEVHALVMEMMSIHPECLYSEAVQMIKPHVLVITNIREDHLAEMGPGKDDIARCFSSAIPKRSTVFVPEEEIYPIFEEKAKDAHARIFPVPKDKPEMDEEWRARLPANEFEQNIRLALAVAGFLEIDQDKAHHGLIKAYPDFGSLKVWRAEWDSPAKTWYFVSAFAANDPESTKNVLTKIEEKGLFKGRARIGLLNLRADRGARTIQWSKALRDESAFSFDKLVFVGEHALALEKKLKGRIKAEILAFKTKKPEKLMTQVSCLETQETVLVGMGNMGGMGQRLVEYWEAVGRRHDL
jgi:poly-gamma-glutamate synthase PgsB/CapB